MEKYFFATSLQSTGKVRDVCFDVIQIDKSAPTKRRLQSKVLFAKLIHNLKFFTTGIGDDELYMFLLTCRKGVENTR